jgi:riboflavin kinase/FMN adenylyltransferase
MKRTQDYRGLGPDDRGAAVAMGNFDGVHLGHQSVLALAHAAAARLAAPFGAVTFEPHPRAFFAPSAPAFRLMTAEARAHRLEKLGVEHLYELTFGAGLAGLSPEAFASEVLVDGLGVVHVVVGADFRFGKGRAGDTAALAALGRELGFGLLRNPRRPHRRPPRRGGAHPRPLAPHRGARPPRREARPRARLPHGQSRA